ncbi:carboxymuconolactone decarboxylase family protein [Roseomonas sp. 18066]|uniref:carboxymuconolactone decarboxylase family protein n=1 Tax=Roseomonas sp. 18066 TaxID=2681412 RepID=UPI00135994F9|nr:carboxymuconolactone decarboxylase family protein [Roseomonas sp. 18066]
MTDDDLSAAARQKGIDSFMATFGRVPENFRLMEQHAPGAFAGYALMRDFVMRDRDAGGALDLKTKELIFALLDTVVGQTNGAKNHAAAAVKAGLTLPELAEGLVQTIMVGGITCWNLTGAEVLRHCEALAVQQEGPGGVAPPGPAAG